MSGWSRALFAPALAATALTWLERIAAAVARAAIAAPPLGTLAVLWCVHAAASLAALVLLAIAAAAARRARPSRRGLAAGAAGAVILAWPAWRLGRALASGDWASRQAWAPAFPWGALALAAASALALGALMRPGDPRGAPPRRGLAAALVAAAAACCLLDVLVLPGLYEAAHVALYAAASVLATCAALAVLGARRLEGRPAVTAGAVAALATLAAPALLALGGAAARAAAVEAPTAGAVFALLAPRPPGTHLLAEIERADLRAAPPPPAAPAAAPLARSVVLILVDTLRADALPPVRPPDAPFARPGDTPALDAWLGGAIRFRRAYAQASRTQNSVPPLFRSLEPFEDAIRLGTPLPEAMRDAGILPVAVVPQYFLMPVDAPSQALLEGFERVEIYEKDHQETLVDQALGVLGEVRDHRFFAWVHFYPMHDPCFAGRPLGDADGAPAERYRAALRWLDGEVGRLLEGLDRLGLAETTAVVLASDHGEQLGAGRRVGHGASVREEEIHVPLALRVPGRPAAVVDGLVGNVDVLPTIFDILGIPADPQHRGRSALPLAEAPEQPSGRVVYVRNGDGGVHGIVDASSKLVYPARHRVFLRYDLRADPDEQRNLFGIFPDDDARLVSELVRRNPRLFADELRDPAVVPRLAAKLSDARVDGPSAPLSFLLRVAEATRAPAVGDAAERLFWATDHADVRAEVAQRLLSADPPRWSRVLERWIQEAAGGPFEAAVVGALARRGVAEFSPAVAAARLGAACAPPSASCEAWLALTRSWSKSPDPFAPPLLAALRAATSPEGLTAPSAPNPALLLAVVSSVARLRAAPGGAAPALAGFEDALLPLAGGDRVLVATAAWRALARTGGGRAREAARAALRDRERDPRVRQAALHALAALAGPGALDDVVAAGGDPLLTVDAVQILGRFGDRRALPFLERVAAEHYNAWTREHAAKAASALRAAR